MASKGFSWLEFNIQLLHKLKGFPVLFLIWILSKINQKKVNKYLMCSFVMTSCTAHTWENFATDVTCTYSSICRFADVHINIIWATWSWRFNVSIRHHKVSSKIYVRVGLSGLPGSHGCQLLARSLASSRFKNRLLGSCHWWKPIDIFCFFFCMRLRLATADWLLSVLVKIPVQTWELLRRTLIY